jgi:hypothetical protein
MTQQTEPSDAASAQQWHLTAQYRQVNRRPAPAARSSDIDDQPRELPLELPMCEESALNSPRVEGTHNIGRSFGV